METCISNISSVFGCIFLMVGGLLSLFWEKARNGLFTACGALLILFNGIMLLFGSSRCYYASDMFLSVVCGIVVGLLGFVSALHAPGYLAEESGRRRGYFWLFFNLTLIAMTMVTQLTSFLPFLLAWEAMGLASFALVLYEYHENSTRRASWIYLLGCEAGGLLLMLGYAMHTYHQVGDLGFFYIMLLGFGLKVGFPLLHVWLPEAHPAAPAPVSAVMSAAMIPLGFCGLFRFAVLSLGISASLLWHCGYSLLVLGLCGALGGIILALGQNNLKRLLAYSSVENMGIVSLGLGLGFLGIVNKMPLVAVSGFCGGVLHILNHSLLKGCLFLGAGSVLKSSGTLDLDLQGGLLKRMPRTGSCFILSSLGICGLPPFCGFTGELLIYYSAFTGLSVSSGRLLYIFLAVAVVLAMTGALACAALVKACSGAFLGEPRSSKAREALPEKTSMVIPQFILLVLAIVMPLIIPFALTKIGLGLRYDLAPIVSVLTKNALFTVVCYVIFVIVWLLRKKFGIDNRQVGTWDCGFAQPTARMEYTASAFAQPLMDQFKGFLGLKRNLQAPQGPFPQDASFSWHNEDPGRRGFWNPLFFGFAKLAQKIHHLQSGYLHLYILIMIIALIAMLLWSFVR